MTLGEFIALSVIGIVVLVAVIAMLIGGFEVEARYRREQDEE